MTVRNYSSSAVQTALTAPISSSATSITVGSVSGFPISYPYALSIDADNVNKEIVDVTAAVGTTLTVTRAVDGTAGVAHTLGAAVSHDHSARDFRDSRTHENATTGVHGVTGALVGTTQTQVLTNKDLSDPSNNLGLPAGTVTLTGTQTLTNKTLTAPAINDGVYKKNTNTLSLPYTAANLAALPSSGVTDGELGATADGKLYQRRSGAWVDISAAGGAFTSVTTTNPGGGMGTRSFTVGDHGNGLCTLRGTCKTTTTYSTTTNGAIINAGDLVVKVNFPTGKFPNKHTGFSCVLVQTGDTYPILGHIEAGGDMYFDNSLDVNTLNTADTFNINVTYAV